MSLHIAIRILVSADYYLKYLDYAQSLLEYFVKQFIIIYEVEYISHNVHGLILLMTVDFLKILFFLVHFPLKIICNI